ncbi:LIM domaincontaining protein [Entamoeba invadens IP1]|uniref:LIM domaincontaining protein n=1 Tax=Entamoeba invadens IP1 TaxID=370355 RepID=A0A0A1UGY4_ENTIV|nr:LIM domaincontaining protein [Entamoeba invadens IP1]ELP94303.1 LIM domaincontaining protein [Entamoeba invadens IP1]|eukprot:XP_004261074.1 LIM domaincontaining protein [Entamoeba invadens IP1]
MECSGCHKTFPSVNSGVKGQQWCDDCFNFKTCEYCHKVINRNMLSLKTYQGKDYHMECFKCCSCKNRLRKDPIVVGSKFYCQDCGQPCPKCGRPIGKEFMELFDKKFHEQCVTCCKCGRGIADEQIFEWQGQPACAVCIELLDV